jgi:hypothetical protein
MNPEWHSAAGKGALVFRHSPQQASVLAGAVAALAGGRGMRHEGPVSDLDGLPEVCGSYF